MADRLCALTVGGAYLGTVDGFERRTEMETGDDLYCEIAPLYAFLPVRFRFDDDFLFAPPPQISLYFTADGVAVYAEKFIRADQSLRVLWQKKIDGTSLTLCMQGKVQLHMQSGAGYFLADLPDAFEHCTARACGGEILLETDGAFLLLSQEGKILVQAEGRVITTGEELSAEIVFHDCLGHTALCTWRRGELLSCTVRAAREPTEATYALALFESVLIGADPLPYLHPSLAAKAGALRGFLGDFLSVVLTDDPAAVGLVYRRKERVYEVRRYRVTVTDGKISNLEEC